MGRAAAAADLRLLCASGVTGGDHRLAGKQRSPLSLFSSPNPKPKRHTRLSNSICDPPSSGTSNIAAREP